MKNKFLKVFTIFLVILTVLTAIVLVYLLSDQYKADNSKLYKFNRKNSYLEYTKTDNKSGFIFYPGAKVQAKAYGYLSELDTNLFIVDAPFNIAFFGMSEAQKIIDSNPHISNWIIGGHSLGGVVSLTVAIQNPLVNRVVLLASYPTKSMKESNIDVLAIFSGNDGLISDYNDKIQLLPETSVYTIIPGGNHAGMGSYGNQKKDNPSTITQEEQHDIIIAEIEKWRNK